jgi:ankyrin repeat protein
MSHEEFLSAVRSGNADVVSTMLREDASLASASDGGVSALLLAVYHGHPEIARSIAAHRELTLHEACAIGDEEEVMRLIAADPQLLHTPGPDGHYPLGLAIFFRHPMLARKLIEAGANVTAHSKNAQNVAPIHAAAAVCDAGIVELLLERGADANAKQELGYGALHTAAGRGDLETARLLLKHGADRDSRGSDGKSPADVAREHGQENFAAWLASQ